MNDDVLYKTIKEKAIGLTIKFESNMKEAYDSIIKDFNTSGDFIGYLGQQKEKIMKLFNDMKCNSFRTLISTIGYIQKIHSEMQSKNYHTGEYYDQIMDEFIEYIVLFTIYYRNGGKVSNLELKTEMEYIQLGNGIFGIRGFKFLEIYCTMLNFCDDEFKKVLTALRKESKENEIKFLNSRVGVVYDKLFYWWQLEDDELKLLIEDLKEQVLNDEYALQKYQNILQYLIIFIIYKFIEIDELDKWIDIMNEKIQLNEDKKYYYDIQLIGNNFTDEVQYKKTL